MRWPLFQRDPRDRRYQERLAGSTLASLVIHALIAAFLFAVVATSSQQGTTENVEGGEVVTLEQRAPVVPSQPVPTPASVPLAHVPRIAPVHHAPLNQPQAQRQPQNRHELAKQSPKAPPNPRPIPQRSPQPVPAPTQNFLENQPQRELPAAPASVPTVAPVVVAVKAPPTRAPSPAPTVAPAVKPSPKPVVRATATPKRATPAPAAASPVPSPTMVAARVTAAPSASPAPAASASAPPRQRAGVPSPRPTATSAVVKTAGAAASPGPKSGASPGPRPGAGHAKAAPVRPVQVPPTPSPRPATPAPKSSAANNLNAKLRALLPHGPVNPTSRQYVPALSLNGRLDPTPPPDVLAKTKYLYDVTGTGNEARIRMWVTDARKDGPTTMCTGWLVRYPEPERGGYSSVPSNVHVGPANGTQIAIGGNGPASQPLSPFDAGIAPIVEGIVSQPCDGRRLVPFATSPAPSP